MIIQMKIGTHPMSWFRVKGIRKLPKIGQTISVMRAADYEHASPFMRPYLWRVVVIDSAEQLGKHPDSCLYKAHLR